LVWLLENYPELASPRGRFSAHPGTGPANFIILKFNSMPWYNGDYPPSYKNQPVRLRNKAVEIANALLEEGVEEGIAIATGLKRAREYFAEKEKNAGKTPGKSKRN
jgi:hypothetical protein